ncbi:MAG: hypothetical protein HOA17_06650 [Candidatus Melainabacteria bacterium]|nr:hypothetical protein [Candidatus Melainabacteria bacterium]
MSGTINNQSPIGQVVKPCPIGQVVKPLAALETSLQKYKKDTSSAATAKAKTAEPKFGKPVNANGQKFNTADA